MQHLKAYSELLEKELAEIPFPHSPANLYDPLSYFLQLGGKRMRPILTLMGAELFKCQKQNAIPAAIAIELFHNFTLIHDDIMDEAPLRRNKETIHAKWNRNIAILSGDVLLVKAYQFLAKQNKEHLPKLLDLFNKTAIEVCEGQQLDMDFESRTNVSIIEYIEMIRLKTSVLLGCALEMGAIIANATDSDRKHIYNFGQHLGIAFQIQDDILDLYADQDKFGKLVGGDVIANKKTLLYIKAHESADTEHNEILQQLVDEPNIDFKVLKTREIYAQIGVKEKCDKIMQKHYHAAMEYLNQIEVAQNLKSPLIDLADMLMLREV